MSHSLPPLTLHDWEMIPGLTPAPKTAPVDFVIRAPWRGHERELGVRKVEIFEGKYNFHFRVLDDPHEINWVTNDIPRPWPHDDAAKYLAYFLGQPSPELKILRMFAMPNPIIGIDWAVGKINSEGFGTWRLPTNYESRYKRRQANFGFQFEGDFWTLPAQDLWQQFQTTFADTNSDLHFALDWANTSLEQLKEKSIRWRNSDANEFCQVLHWILAAYTTPTNDVRVSKLTFRVWSSNFWWHNEFADGSREYITPTPTIQHLQEFLCRRFGPYIPDALQPHVCVYDCFEENLFNYSVELNDHTAHDQIEAMVSLREWLSQQAALEGPHTQTIRTLLDSLRG